MVQLQQVCFQVAVPGHSLGCAQVDKVVLSVDVCALAIL